MIRIAFCSGIMFLVVDAEHDSPVFFGDENYKCCPFGMCLFTDVFGEHGDLLKLSNFQAGAI